MAKRYFSDYLTAYLKYTENTEPPKSYHTWICISMIAAALQRRTWLKWGYETLYPNMYVVLVGPSGRCRKGTALGIGKDILADTGASIAVASESITREALIRKMNDATNSFTDPVTRDFKFHCSITAISPELSVFLGQNDVKFLADLTDWYDSSDEWTYETKGQGKDKIQGLCFNLLGATAPDWFSSILPQEAIGGGFTSRIIFVVEEKKGQSVAEDIQTPEHKEIRKRLISDLEQIATLTGPYTFAPDAKDAYISWYEEEDEKLQNGRMVIQDARFAGYCERRATHVRKLAMILSASRGDDLVIHLEDFARALDALSAIEGRMHKAFSGLGRAAYSEATDRVLNFIKSRHVASRSEVMRRFYRDVDGGTLKIIEEVLEYMKVVKITKDIERNETVYRYVGDDDE